MKVIVMSLLIFIAGCGSSEENGSLPSLEVCVSGILYYEIIETGTLVLAYNPDGSLISCD